MVSTRHMQMEVVSYNRSCETVEQLCYVPGSHQLAVIQVGQSVSDDDPSVDCCVAIRQHVHITTSRLAPILQQHQTLCSS